jgi:hypothetical protein
VADRPAPEVVLIGEDDASGMASMLAALLADNVRDFPGRARIAARARGSVVLRTADHGLDVTVSFCGGRVEVRDGAADGVTVVAGPWLTMAQLCSGQLSPVRAVRAGDLDVQPGRGLPAAAAAGYVLSVPESFYREADAPVRGDDRSAVIIMALAAVVTVGAWGLVLARRRHRRSS